MKLQLIFLFAILLLPMAVWAQAEPPWIFGMHEPGGEQNAVDMGKRAWILFTEELGADPNNQSSRDYRPWSDAGHGVIVRLNYGYNPNGTLPPQTQYDNFAKRVANFVKNSKGARIWIIGNEPNLPVEWPGGENGEPITVARYVAAYNKCYDAIKALPGHESDVVAAAPAGTWSPPWPQHGIPGFVDYWVQIVTQIGARQQALILHAYTHGANPNLIFDETKMGPPYQDIYYHFRVYRNYLAKVPASLKQLPVYITETGLGDEGGRPVPWPNVNNGWIKNAYREIDTWNRGAGNQAIRALILYRWPNVDPWHIESKPETIRDWREAMANDYRWDNVSNGRLSGIVRNARGGGIGGAEARLSPGDHKATTNSLGAYNFASVPAGTYTLTVTKSGYGVGTVQNVVVVANQTRLQHVTLPDSQSLIINGGFEAGSSSTGVGFGWLPWVSPWSNPVQFGSSADPVYNGLTSQRWGRSDNLRVHGGVFQAVPVEPGRRYRLEASVRYRSTDPGAWLEVGYDLTGQTTDGEAASVQYQKLETLGHDAWHRASRVVQAVAPHLTVFLKFGQYWQVGTGPHWAWADEVSLVPVARVNAVLNLEGWAVSTLGSTVSIELTNEGGAIQQAETVELDAAGRIQLHTAYQGPAYLVLRKPGFLTRKSALFMVASSDVDLALNLVPGDVNGDNTVDDADLTEMILSFGGAPSGPYAPDLDGDGIVDDADLTLIALSFGQTGD